jgi:hypothetical protein
MSAATADHVDELLASLDGAVRRAQEAGPVVVDPGVAEVVRALDPDTLGDEDFDGLLVAAGLSGGPGQGLALPRRMAEVNALLDLASPALREAVLVAFLDRLARPVRA